MEAHALRELGKLIAHWRDDPQVERTIVALRSELAAGTEAFVGAPLDDEEIRGRLPRGVASAWIFVLRANHRNAAHFHPNSTQITAVIHGRGRGQFGAEEFELRTFDAENPEQTIYAIAAGTPHAFQTENEPLVVVSFHTVPPEELVEIEVDSARSRTYVGGARRELRGCE